MKTSDCFAEKSRGRSEPQKEVRYFSPWRNKVYVEEKVDSWKSPVNGRYEGWIENSAIKRSEVVFLYYNTKIKYYSDFSFL
jgi:hypothetical protein